MLCASGLSAALLLGSPGADLRNIPFSTDHLEEFMNQGPSPEPAPTGYRINIAKSTAQNNLRKGRATKAVVEVRDRNNKPVAGIAVVFLLPGSGPSGTFAGGGTSLTVTTNAAGQAVASYTPNQVAGMFNLTVNANLNGVTVATANVAQANLAAAAAAGAGMSGTTIGIIAGVAAAAAVGIGVGIANSGSSGSPATPVPTSVRIIGGGNPVFGPTAISAGRGR
ncbi:Ig-like domain-containing protein [Bryobacter aggregatus]|uniref:Ig-like domain-containing protein n=1 Tax=Bryobacter aggregatus TaxID=360054 RepID=UPI0004E1A209|nr:Ig-like domain-containing protein [Bryobacter aggregatus]